MAGHRDRPAATPRAVEHTDPPWPLVEKEPWIPAVGDGVVYRPYPGAPAEDGTITELRGGGMALVLYVGDRTAKSTRIADLEPLRSPKP